MFLSLGLYWMCGHRAYFKLPPRWIGGCSLGFIVTDMSLAMANMSFPFPVYHRTLSLTGSGAQRSPGNCGAAPRGSSLKIQSQLSQEIAENFWLTAVWLDRVSFRLTCWGGFSKLQSIRPPHCEWGRSLPISKKGMLFLHQSHQVQEDIYRILNSID